LPTLRAGAAARAGHGARDPERPGAPFWLPALVLAAGVVLWAEWGFAVAFEAIRTYCF
jgi:hypothetical protein